MIEFLQLAEKDRFAAYRVVADELNLNEAIIEKDFWVCVMLEVLFKYSKYAENFAFKGGTSLSKAYNVIKRFSEDIDLILDWRALGYKEAEPWSERSKTSQRKFNDQANERAANWIREEFFPELRQQITQLGILGITLKIDDNDQQTIQVFYPKAFENNSILQEIRLEIGPLAAWTPIRDQEIQPYLAESLPHLFENPIISVPTVEAKRTFWEKATILHKEAHRVSTKTPPRYTRHYYDVYQLGRSVVKNEAFMDENLLKRVVMFKTKFYADNSAKYELATLNAIQLLPNEEQLASLYKDYDKMQAMMFEDSPSFEEIINELTILQEEIHHLTNKK